MTQPIPKDLSLDSLGLGDHTTLIRTGPVVLD